MRVRRTLQRRMEDITRPEPPVAIDPAAVPTPDASHRPLFRTWMVGLAAVLAGVLGGGVLLALNYRAMDRGRDAWVTMGLSVIGFIVVLVLAAFVPEEVPSIVFAAVQVVVMVHVARSTQGAIIDARAAAGLPMRSGWAAAGIALLVLLVLILLAVAAFDLYLRANGLSWSDLFQELATQGT